MALLGEMHFQASGPESYFNLPRDEGVAYAAQESWVQNETIRVCLRIHHKTNELNLALCIGQCLVWITL